MTRKKVIRVPLSGGFGNQLFQIIFSLFVRQQMSIPVVVEGRQALRKPEHENSSLSNIDWKILGLEYSEKMPMSHQISSPMATFFREASSFVQDNRKERQISNGLFGIYHELTDEALMMDVKSLQKPNRLVGYFQHSYYFESLNEASKQCLYSALAEYAESNNAIIEPANVALHLRRGDYRNHPHLTLLDTTYYEQVMVAKNISGSVVVFTDEPNDDEIREFSKKIGAKISEVESAKDVFFSLLGANLIIGANSSLSMSAAMLSRKTKESIFPSKWGSASYHDFTARGAYPSKFQVCSI